MPMPRKEVLVLPDEKTEYQSNKMDGFVKGVRLWINFNQRSYLKNQWAPPNPSNEEIIATIDQLKNPVAIKFIKAYLRGASLSIFSQALQGESMRDYLARKNITLSNIQKNIADIFETKAIEAFEQSKRNSSK